MIPRFDVSPDQIDQVVAEFYRQVRRHPQLGPIFHGKVADWPAHEAKIASFWRNAILGEGAYTGNPMQVHHGVPGITAEHFRDWLDIFDSVLAENLDLASAQSWSALAHRIGRGLRMGLATSSWATNGVPQITD